MLTTRKRYTRNHCPGPIDHLVTRHDHLETLNAEHVSHALPTRELWLALVAIEDRLREEHPRAYAHWIAIWGSRRPERTHPRGAHDPQCSICQHRAPATASSRVAAR